MKTIITLLLLSLFLHGNPHYMMEAVAYDNWAGTLFQSEDGNVWAVDDDHYHGDVVLVMSNNGTPDYIYDDRIIAVIER